MKKYLLIVTYLCIIHNAFGQDQRIIQIEKRLNELSATIPQLNEKTEIAVSNSPVKEFLRGIAQNHSLSLDISEEINQKITAYFFNERVTNILLYCIKQFNLDVEFNQSIISIFPYKPPVLILPPIYRDPLVSFNPESQTITLELKDDTLSLVAKKITKLSNRNILIPPDIGSKLISGYFQNLSVPGALEKIAIGNNLKLNLTSDSVYILESLKQNEELLTKQSSTASSNYFIKKNYTNQAGSLINQLEVYDDGNGSKLINLNTINTPIKDVIKAIAEQGNINYFLYSELTGMTTANVKGLPFDRVLSFILQGTRYTYTIENTVYMIGDRRDEGLRAHKLIKLQYRSVDSLLSILPPELMNSVEIKEFKELNSFLLSGSQPQIKEIEQFVKELDRTVPMVMIEVILMDIRKVRTVQTGINMGVSDSVRTGGTLLNGLDFTFGSGDINRFIDQIGLNNVFNIGRVTPNFYVSLRALENSNNVELRQTPKLSTLNGHAANLSIGSTRYYQIRTQSVVPSINAQTIVTEQFIPVEANLSIDIKPFVSGDEHVTLNIAVNISDFLGNTPINLPPPTSTSKFKSIIRVKNEEMIVLGGIERNEKSEDGSGIPFLSRIPILKWIFSNRTKTNGKTVSVVFIKPTIIF